MVASLELRDCIGEGSKGFTSPGTCESCHFQNVNVEAEIKYSNFPHFLSVEIIRVNDKGLATKSKRPVYLDRFIEVKINVRETFRYRAIIMIMHAGDTGSHGHFVCSVDSHNAWTLFNDDKQVTVQRTWDKSYDPLNVTRVVYVRENAPIWEPLEAIQVDDNAGESEDGMVLDSNAFETGSVRSHTESELWKNCQVTKSKGGVCGRIRPCQYHDMGDRSRKKKAND